MYIPDLTERFPEGFGGVDMTDRYFPDWGTYELEMEERMWEAMEQEYNDTCDTERR